MAKYPAAFETLEGVVRLNGELDFLDPSSQPIGPAGGVVLGTLSVGSPTVESIAPTLTIVAPLQAAIDDTELISTTVDGATNTPFSVSATGEVISSLDDVNGSVGLQIKERSTNKRLIEARAATPVRIDYGIKCNPIAAGALPTVNPVSGNAFQCDATRDVHLVTPCTFNPTAGAAATVKVELSPDNVTFSTLATVTEPAGVALDGTILPVSVHVPADWRVKLTATNAVLGVGTYY